MGGVEAAVARLWWRWLWRRLLLGSPVVAASVVGVVVVPVVVTPAFWLCFTHFRHVLKPALEKQVRGPTVLTG